MTPDPAAIAEEMSVIERKALLLLDQEHQAKDWRRKTVAALVGLKLANLWIGMTGLKLYIITPLGRAVAAAIREREG